jgi:capsular polysaccharide transport system permease protein
MTYGPLGFAQDRRAWADAVRLQIRVVSALIRRETRAHYGESRLGYLWAVIEPLGHLTVLCVLFIYILHRRAPVGGSLAVFFLTGLGAYFLYSHIASYMTGAVAANKALLNLPPVKPIDVIVARAILEASNYLLVVFLLFSALAVWGVDEAIPWDPMTLAEAIGVICLLGFGVGMINVTISLYIHKWGFLFGLVSGPLYFFSGIFFSISEIPPPYRDYLQYNPLLHCVVWFRLGFYHGLDEGYLDRGYVLRFAVAAVVIGFGLLRVTRRKILEP